jgi:predicted nucleotidyltransferase
LFGILEEDTIIITSVIGKYIDVEEAVIFGSRAKGNFKNGSDVDIVLKGKNISRDTVLSISGELNEETVLPYHFDILNYSTIQNEELVKHIQRVGKIIYTSP